MLSVINQLIGDINLAITGFKIIVLLFIIQFIRSHFNAGVLPILLTIVIGYIFLFHYWAIFGPIMLVYFLLIFGFTSALLDIAIVKPWAGGGGASMEAAGPSGKDAMQASIKHRMR